MVYEVSRDPQGTFGPVKYAFVNVAASATASSVVAAVTGGRIRVISLVVLTGGTATDVTFNSASSAISCKFACAANGGVVLPKSESGWFQTVPGQALTVTTGAGSTTGIQVIYEVV